MALLFTVGVGAGEDFDGGAFRRFHEKAERGEAVTVVFLGGSLTWGANASDPNLTSWRGLMGEYLQARYPRAQIRVYDAAIGGTGSTLAIYRLDRDVLARRPDLVFLEFTINDNYLSDAAAPSIAYETLVRRLVGADIGVMQIFLTGREMLGEKYHPENHRRTLAYKKLADAYHTPWADAAPYMQQQLEVGAITLAECFPIEGTHPIDVGYRVWFEAARDAYELATREPPTATMPAAPIFGVLNETYRVSVVEDLPEGWRRAITFRTAMWFDGLPSRWMGDVAVCDAETARGGKSLRREFIGTQVGIFGETDANGLGVKILIDGKIRTPNPTEEIWRFDTQRLGGGRLFYWREIANDLAAGRHTLEIVPVAADGAVGEFHLESICSAQ
jgi:lysophospholipase L1-like esterase